MWVDLDDLYVKWNKLSMFVYHVWEVPTDTCSIPEHSRGERGSLFLTILSEDFISMPMGVQ